MAMNGSVLGEQIIFSLKGVTGLSNSDPLLSQAWQAVATAIVTHIQTQAEVSVTTLQPPDSAGDIEPPGTGTGKVV